MKKQNLITRAVERYRHNRRFELSYLRTFLFNRFSKDEEQAIKAYHSKHAGETGVVIANGPSLNDVNLDRLKQFVTIGMNRIYLLYEKTDFRPTYYCVEDHMVAEDNSSEISSLADSVMFIPKDLSYCININSNSNILYTNFIRRYRGVRTEPEFSYDFAQRCYWGGTVTFYSLQLAYYLGLKKVYIVGLDHNYTKPSYAKGRKIVSCEDDVNHFDPRYFGKGKRWHNTDLDKMQRSYGVARRAFDRAGRQVINATPQSKLSEAVLPKTHFENII